jgi:hypothetical protein
MSLLVCSGAANVVCRKKPKQSIQMLVSHLLFIFNVMLELATSLDHIPVFLNSKCVSSEHSRSPMLRTSTSHYAFHLPCDVDYGTKGHRLYPLGYATNTNVLLESILLSSLPPELEQPK